MEDRSQAVEIPGPESAAPTSAVVEVVVSLLSVIQVQWGEKKAPLKPNHFGYVYGTSSQTAAVVQLWDG